MIKVFFLVGGFGFISTARSELTIQEAVDLWILDGAEFRQMVNCSQKVQLSHGVRQIHYNSLSCRIGELAIYALAKECSRDSKVARVGLWDTVTQSRVMSFRVNPTTCSLLDKRYDKSNVKVEHLSKTSTPSSLSSTTYVIQLYSGSKPPNKVFAKCATVPLYEHQIHNSYYLVSDVFSSYSKAQELMKHLHSQCPDLSMWIRPIKR